MFLLDDNSSSCFRRIAEGWQAVLQWAGKLGAGEFLVSRLGLAMIQWRPGTLMQVPPGPYHDRVGTADFPFPFWLYSLPSSIFSNLRFAGRSSRLQLHRKKDRVPGIYPREIVSVSRDVRLSTWFAASRLSTDVQNAHGPSWDEARIVATLLPTCRRGSAGARHRELKDMDTLRRFDPGRRGVAALASVA
ncbi:hypothetical protein N656DRAFT_575251 [Canariomyces notabilis]|uniref:Uncharacterized protein n=1 Tax=Canariomyces notabilis TaxID=2074819 RepID=A0AAN6YU72_9PEZI|nr:hypothetical protein N656DRAFT_575251 [Canariomyces arenarius]